MSNRAYDAYMEKEHLRDEYCCCDCGYVNFKKMAHHPGIRCPQTGSCGECGNDWPCEEHSHLVPAHLVKNVNRESYVKK